ncbi:MAG: serine/threonine-protein kinase [Gammaproteobacteria bacterium]|nr:serine/threonine-protein kinase [Gammaproteobacteria bacterium]
MADRKTRPMEPSQKTSPMQAGTQPMPEGQAPQAAAGKKAPTRMPKKLGKYRLKKELGRGSSGMVYLGKDPFEDREVAIKIYYGDDELSPQQANLQSKLFFNEAHLAGQLKHPNILPIHDAGEEEGQRYVVMEYLPDTQPLSNFAKNSNLLPLEKVVEIFFSAAKALDYAHSNGVVHRDIKPANILMNSRGHTLIVDFGIAKSSGIKDVELLGTIGTPRYMSPEQIRGESVGNQTDLYSLGVSVYELLTGMSPYYASTLNELTHKILKDNPVPVSEYRPDLPEILSRVVMRCMRKDPRKRYQTGLDIAGDLAYIFDEISEATQELPEEERFRLTRDLKFFSLFEDEELQDVLRAGEWKQYASGQNIITEGEEDDSFFVIVSGDVSVWKNDTELGVLTEGDVFGEMGFNGRVERTATVRARGSVSVLCLNQQAIERASPDAQLKFNKVFVNTLIDRLARTNEKLSQRG